MLKMALYTVHLISSQYDDYMFIFPGQDEALNKRIQQIQEKNAKILRRKMEVEQDKQKYG